jgi:hypothetical protein
MKFLIPFILITITTARAQWVRESEILSKNWTSVSRRAACPGTCYKVPVGSAPAFIELEEVTVNDLTKPVYSKTDVVGCVETQDDPETTEVDETITLEDDCREKLAALDCTGKGEAIRAADNSEVYCSMLLRYEQKPAGYSKAVVNEALKSQWEAERAAKKAERQAVQSQVKDMDFGRQVYAAIQLLNKGKGLSKAQRRTLRQNLKTMRDDLLDGNICDVRADLVALSADGTLIREADKTAILARLDAYKTCP